MADHKAGNPLSRRGIVIALSLILTAQIAGSYAISLGERLVPTLGLENIPTKIGDWSMVGEQPLDPDVVAYLKPDDYIQRGYLRAENSSSMSLFVAYFKSLQNVYGPHSPSVCLPGSGWLVRDSKVIHLPVAGKPQGIPANEYVLEKNGENILVLYWYQNDRRVWAEEFEFKLHLIPDLLRYHRSDVSLIRIVTPLGRDGSISAAMKNASAFVTDLFPDLSERFAASQ